MPVPLEDRKKILELFKEAFEGYEDFIYIDGINPCSADIFGKRYNIYIKNLTPAQLSNNNENIWRIQLPKRKAFEEIKNNSAMFLLLGYDKDADVFTTWNPYWAKQRLNVGESVSMYSRHNLQQEACVEEKIIEAELNHSSKVILFPRNLLPEYLKNLDKYFPAETKYVAIGSSLRKTSLKTHKNLSSSQLFLLFSNKDNLFKFQNFLNSSTTLKAKTISNYIRCMEFVFDNNIFNKNKSLFTPVTTIDMYGEILSILYKNSTLLKEQDVTWHGAIHASLMKYLLFIKKEIRAYNTISKPDSNEDEKSNTGQLLIDGCVSEPYKIDFIIKNISIVDKIITFMSQDPPQTLKSMEILADYMGDGFPGKRSLKQWHKYIAEFDWISLRTSLLNKTNEHHADIVDSIIEKYGEYVSEKKANNLLKMKKIEIIPSEQFCDRKIICSIKGKLNFFIADDSPLVKLYDRGATVYPANKSGTYKVLVKTIHGYRIIKFKYDGTPLEKDDKLF